MGKETNLPDDIAHYGRGKTMNNGSQVKHKSNPSCFQKVRKDRGLDAKKAETSMKARGMVLWILI
jgi:hypothetical protein